jgi:hypothetical protein
MNTAILSKTNHSAIISIMFNFRRSGMFGGINLTSIITQAALAAATGGASLAVTMQQMAMRAVVQMAIQKLGQELGLPPAVINMAQTFAAGQMSGAGAADFNAMGSGASFQNQAMSQFSAVGQGLAQRAFDEFGSASNGLGRSMSQIDRRAETTDAAYRDAVANGASDRELRPLEQARDDAQAAKQNMDKFITDMFLSDNRKKLEGDAKEIMNGKGSLLMKLAVLLGRIADQKMSDMATKAEQMGKFGEVKGKNQGKFQQLSSELQALGQELNVVSQAATNVIKSIGEAASTLARK